MTEIDRAVLRSDAYGEPSKLLARQRLWSYADRTWLSGRIRWAHPLRGDETVVDLGCGNGADLRAVHAEGHRGPLIGVDFSPGMLGAIPPEQVRRTCGDAAAIPLAARSADVVCAMHMLYHVPDIASALREVRRVLRAGGVFLASTNSEHAARELIEPWSAAMVDAGGPPLVRQSHAAFSIESGAPALAEAFASVEVKRIEITARVPSADVVRDYVASTDDLYRAQMPDPRAWERVVEAVHQHATAVIARRGSFDVTQHAGVFVCRT